MISQTCIDLVKKFEGCRLKAYDDPAGLKTIGYGHKVLPHENLDEISQAQADELLRHDLSAAHGQLLYFVETPLNQNQLDALTSLTFNIGIGALRQSRLFFELNGRNLWNASTEILRWIHIAGVVSEGLLRRREAERELFLKPVEQACT